MAKTRYMLRIWFHGWPEPQELRLTTDNVIVTYGVDGYSHVMAGKDGSKKLADIVRFKAKVVNWDIAVCND